MKHLLPAAVFLSLVLAMPGIAADKRNKPTGTPSTLPPTSPMLVVPPPNSPSADGAQPGKLISSEMSGRDLAFFTKAVDAGREQAFFVNLLTKEASSDQIKKLAEELMATQSEENAHIARLATQKGWSVSLDPTPAQRKEAGDMERLSGSNLDKAVMDRVITASSRALKAYQDAAQSTDPQIKTFGMRMLPLAEEKRHIVEKMTGAGAKTANELFRHGGASQSNSNATPAPSSKATFVPTPTPTPSVPPLPIATPPGVGAPAPSRPPIVPRKTPPTPTPAN